MNGKFGAAALGDLQLGPDRGEFVALTSKLGLELLARGELVSQASGLLLLLGRSPAGLVAATAAGIVTALVLVETFTSAGAVRSTAALLTAGRRRGAVGPTGP